jgi:hypothetical protein
LDLAGEAGKLCFSIPRAPPKQLDEFPLLKFLSACPMKISKKNLFALSFIAGQCRVPAGTTWQLLRMDL